MLKNVNMAYIIKTSFIFNPKFNFLVMINRYSGCIWMLDDLQLKWLNNKYFCFRKNPGHLGFPSLLQSHKTLIPAIVEELKELGRNDIMVICGGVIPTQDYKYLYDAGAAAIFGPGTSVAGAGKKRSLRF